MGISHNLPARLTSFVGREREVADIVRLLGEARLVTLVGAPGVGKTRLALRLASDMIPAFAHGVWLVELAPLSEPSLIPQAVVAALRVSEQPRRPLLATLTEHLEQRELLLVLDNCEHLVAACASLAEALLQACPTLRILATSREALRIEGEVTWRVPSLTTPNSDAAASIEESVGDRLGFESMRLFLDRARAALPSFELSDDNRGTVGQICRRLDGIPLAIELAAARTRAMSPEQIAARLDDRFALLTSGSRTALPRQQTLHAAVEWSYELLSEPERTLLRRLAVFAGGFTPEAAEAVCCDKDDRPSVLDLLLQLVDKSLVQADPASRAAPRYRLPETIREYGFEQLRVHEEEATIRRGHLAWFTDLAERSRPGVHSPDGASGLDRLAVDLDNFRAALSWSVADHDHASVSAGLALAGSLFPFWLLRGYLTEGQRWFEQVLAADLGRGRLGGAESTLPAVRVGAGGAHPRVVALNGLALLYEHVGDMERAIVPTQEALALAREVRDRVGEGHALVELGNIARIAGEYERAIPLIEEGLAIFRTLDDRNGIRVALRVLGDTRYLAGDGERARALLEESLALVKSMGFSWGVAVTLRLLGIVAHGQGDLDRAMALLEESLAVFAPLRVMHGPHYARCELGHVVLARGDPRRASACFTESLEVSREVGDQRGVVRCLEGLAGIAAATVDGESDTGPIRAARLLGASAALRETLGIPVTPIERSTVERASAAVRANVGEDAYAEAWAGGWALPLDEAIELALATAASQSSSATIDGSASRPRSTSPLTPREVEVASLVARGLTNRQTAAELVISERTVDGHVASILSKLGFATRAQIAAWAVQRGIVTPIEPE